MNTRYFAVVVMLAAIIALLVAGTYLELGDLDAILKAVRK